MLMCFSVNTGDRLWAMRAPKPAAEITVLAQERCILVGRPHEVPGCDYLLKLTFEGRVIGKCPASPYEAISLAEAERQAGRLSIAARWFRIAAEADIAGSYRAKAYRALGELAEDDEKPKDALDLYKTALTLDANAGVRRRIEKLSSALGE